MKLLATIIVCSLILGIFFSAPARGGDVDLTIEGEVLTARLRGIPLKAILEKLERERGIWFKGNSSLLDERITVQFTNLPLEKGLNRILAPMNYSLVFDRNGRVAGVVVVARGTENRQASETRPADVQRTPSSTVPERAFVNPPVNNTRKGSPNDGKIKGIKEDPKEFTVTRDYPPPTDSAKVIPQGSSDFKVIKDSPPPGGVGEVAEGEREEFTVIRGCPPPGGPGEISAQKLEQFKVIENCPPPGN